MSDTWTIKRVLDWTVNYFEKNQVPDARLSADILLSHVLDVKRLHLYLQFERILTPGELKQYRELIGRRIQFEPVQYITGDQEFMGLTFHVTPDVLIPRPETEILVEHMLDSIEDSEEPQVDILDAGTGSGIIAISLAYFCKKCNVLGIDTNPRALQIAMENAGKLNVSGASFRLQDAMSLRPDKFGKFNYVVSNPPYISESEYDDLHPQIYKYEPEEALLAGKDGLDFIRQLIPMAYDLLKKNGLLFMEIGFNQKNNVDQLLQSHGFKNIQFIRDYHRIERIVRAEK